MADKHDDGGRAADTTVLDYFAACALSGIMANPTWAAECARAGEPVSSGAAVWSYKLAAAMVAEKRRMEGGA